MTPIVEERPEEDDTAAPSHTPEPTATPSRSLAQQHVLPQAHDNEEDVVAAQGEDQFPDEEEEDEPAGAEELQQMDDLEKRLESELESALAELAGFMQNGGIDDVQGDLRVRMAKLAPRCRALQGQSKAVRGSRR